MEKVKITTEYIKLDQFLKYAGIIDYGSDAKIIIQNGNIQVNGEVATQRGKKLRKGDTIVFEGKSYEIDTGDISCI